MSTVTPTPPFVFDYPPDPPYYRITVEQYHEMCRAGILGEDDRVELLEGWIVEKMTVYPHHRLSMMRTRRALERLLPPGWHVGTQNPITTGDSVPEPDISVIRGSLDDYPDRHPGPNDLALVVEVSDASLRRDQTTKKRIYARAGIPVYWIINIPANRVEVYADPTGPADAPDYRSRTDFGPDEAVPFVIDGVEVGRIAARDLLP
ncbi:MAG TPA: Uma2 family endonuclease [Isosphaeraceae bacterium]|jgi:Uma2 family endonuclease|nr:Uma2 family endonuclease [Isosphaeraceae bacterium]